ncbi:hypothetical protein HK105_204979 [Polyrhizophydium stewartii]|uniref:Membrane-associated protein n=1 Tax=Polyrhizophydium stewartii TaxID=2732419 RepID=A0ABR4N745_9FUNG
MPPTSSPAPASSDPTPVASSSSSGINLNFAFVASAGICVLIVLAMVLARSGAMERLVSTLLRASNDTAKTTIVAPLVMHAGTTQPPPYSAVSKMVPVIYVINDCEWSGEADHHDDDSSSHDSRHSDVEAGRPSSVLGVRSLRGAESAAGGFGSLISASLSAPSAFPVPEYAMIQRYNQPQAPSSNEPEQEPIAADVLVPAIKAGVPAWSVCRRAPPRWGGSLALATTQSSSSSSSSSAAAAGQDTVFMYEQFVDGAMSAVSQYVCPTAQCDSGCRAVGVWVAESRAFVQDGPAASPAARANSTATSASEASTSGASADATPTVTGTPTSTTAAAADTDAARSSTTAAPLGSSGSPASSPAATTVATTAASSSASTTASPAASVADRTSTARGTAPLGFPTSDQTTPTQPIETPTPPIASADPTPQAPASTTLSLAPPAPPLPSLVGEQRVFVRADSAAPRCSRPFFAPVPSTSGKLEISDLGALAKTSLSQWAQLATAAYFEATIPRWQATGGSSSNGNGNTNGNGNSAKRAGGGKQNSTSSSSAASSSCGGTPTSATLRFVFEGCVAVNASAWITTLPDAMGDTTKFATVLCPTARCERASCTQLAAFYKPPTRPDCLTSRLITTARLPAVALSSSSRFANGTWPSVSPVGGDPTNGSSDTFTNPGDAGGSGDGAGNGSNDGSGSGSSSSNNNNGRGGLGALDGIFGSPGVLPAIGVGALIGLACGMMVLAARAGYEVLRDRPSRTTALPPVVMSGGSRELPAYETVIKPVPVIVVLDPDETEMDLVVEPRSCLHAHAAAVPLHELEAAVSESDVDEIYSAYVSVGPYSGVAATDADGFTDSDLDGDLGYDVDGDGDRGEGEFDLASESDLSSSMRAMRSASITRRTPDLASLADAERWRRRPSSSSRGYTGHRSVRAGSVASAALSAGTLPILLAAPPPPRRARSGAMSDVRSNASSSLLDERRL